MTKLTDTIASLIGKKGSLPPVRNQKPRRPKCTLDSRWEEIHSSEMSDEEIYQAMKSSGLINDYPLLQKSHEPDRSDFV